MSRSRLRVGQLFGIAVAALVAVAAGGFVAGMLALDSQRDNRRLVVDRIDPARIAAQTFLTALVDEETGVRGFALGGAETFLEPYERGRAVAAEQLGVLRRIGIEPAGVEAVAVTADAWRRTYAEPTIAARRAGKEEFTVAEVGAGKARFDALRTAVAALEAALVARRGAVREALTSASLQLRVVIVAFAVSSLLAVIAAFLVLRRRVVGPLRALAAQVRGVVSGDFGRHVEAGGAREIVELGDDVDAMRGRIVTELTAATTAREDLERSNAELEQFAYVASHDLQEPLRKVASFTQMLKSRYHGQLDERADTYIDFAVDGAKRMQDLINDLLAFSRVGRMTEPQVEVDCKVLVAGVLSNLELDGARVEVGELPVVRGEPRLLQVVFANLIGNGLKFRRPDVPAHVAVTAERDDGQWCFTVADDGIGIEPEYADRIFVIFQRLHPRAAYEGTGIGLALSRKIVEHHGGTLSLDTAVERGATFRFTLPAETE